MEQLIDDLTFGNVYEVKAVLASVAAALIVVVVATIGTGTGENRNDDSGGGGSKGGKVERRSDDGVG